MWNFSGVRWETPPMSCQVPDHQTAKNVAVYPQDGPQIHLQMGWTKPYKQPYEWVTGVGYNPLYRGYNSQL